MRDGLITANLTIESNTGEDATLSKLTIPLKGFSIYNESDKPFENSADKPDDSGMTRIWIPASIVLVFVVGGLFLLLKQRGRL